MSWQTYGLIILAIGAAVMALGMYRDSQPAPEEEEPYGDASTYGRRHDA